MPSAIMDTRNWDRIRLADTENVVMQTRRDIIFAATYRWNLRYLTNPDKRRVIMDRRERARRYRFASISELDIRSYFSAMAANCSRPYLFITIEDGRGGWWT